MPGGPSSVIRRGWFVAATWSHSSRIACSSPRRPTSGVADGGRNAGSTTALPTSHAATGSRFPFASMGSSGSNVKTSFVNPWVSSPTTTRPGGAADWRRAAVFTMSPVASGSTGPASSVTSASPVATAARICSPSPGCVRFSSSIASSESSAARTARSASSSRASGAPNTAITASPMNFSTTPPNRSIRSRTS